MLMIVGQELRTTNQRAFDDIPAHSKRFHGEGVLAALDERTNDHAYAFYTRSEHPGVVLCQEGGEALDCCRRPGATAGLSHHGTFDRTGPSVNRRLRGEPSSWSRLAGAALSSA